MNSVVTPSIRMNGVLGGEIYPPQGLINASLERVLGRGVAGNGCDRFLNINSSIRDRCYFFC